MKNCLKYNAAIASGVILMFTAMAACSSERDDSRRAENVVAAVGGVELTIDEVRRHVPAGLSGTDSTAFVAAFVDSWIDEQLLTEVAIEEIGDTEEIDRLTEEYRRRLIMWEYRRLRVSGDTSLAISSDDVADYYAAHSSQMTLTEPMVRGIYIKIDDHSRQLPQVRKWYKSTKNEDIDRLEKVGLNDAIHYDYFRNKWVPWKQIETKIPTEIHASNLRKGFTLDFSAGGFTYLLSVSDVLPVGGVMPLEAAELRIRETLEALRLNELDAKLRADMRRQAQADGRLWTRAKDRGE